MHNITSPYANGATIPRRKMARDQGSGVRGQAPTPRTHRSSRPCRGTSLAVSILVLLGAVGVCAAGEITESVLREALVTYIEDSAPAGVEMEQWDLRRGDLLPLRGEIVDVNLAAGARWRARTPIRVKVETASGSSRTLWVTADLHRARTVVIARRALPMGHRIGPDDVTAEVREGWRNHEDLYARTGEVVGKKVWRPVSKGACVKSWHVRDRRDMAKGQYVVIIAESGAVRVQAPGQLLESGNPGDRVRVMNRASGKELYATVVDAHTVLVSF